MERLTGRNAYGEAYYKGCHTSPCDGTGESCDNCSLIDVEVCEALAAYEDTGLTPERIIEMDKEYQKMRERLSEYQKAEEQGLLLKLPCKVGDTLYRIDTDEKIKNAEIEPCTIKNIVICDNGEVLFKFDYFGGVICRLENIITDKPYLDYYRVFLTQSEAEEALRKMKQEE